MAGTAHILQPLRRAARRVRSLWPVRVRGGHGAGLRMDLSRASAWYARGDNERPVQDAVVANLKPGDVFFDIGANAGFFGLIAARIVGEEGRVIAFEPVPATAATIRRSVRLNRLKNVTVIEAAVSDASGTGEILADTHPGGAVLSNVGGGTPPTIVQRANVRVVAIDDLVERGDVPRPTMVKIDVEGAEAQVLAGMTRTAAHYRPSIICEVDDQRAEAAAEKMRSVEAILSSWGYTLRRLERSYPVGGGAWEVEHVLAVRE